MKIRAREVRFVDVEISKEDLKTICADFLQELIGMSSTDDSGWYINADGDLFEWKRMSSGESKDVFVRKANQFDQAVALLLGELE